MMPCKFASPTFAVTAAVLGGIALASSTCSGAVIDLFTSAPQHIERADLSGPEVTDSSSLVGGLFGTRRLELRDGLHQMTVSVSTSGNYLESSHHHHSRTLSHDSPLN